MNLRRNGVLLFGLGVFVALLCCSDVATGNLVFNVQHRYGGLGHGGRSMLRAFKAHDAQRHQRKLVALDLPLGGDGQITGSGLYFTKLAIGTPPKDFYVQVDTGSDILWVNCAGCNDCPKNSNLGIDLAMYDLKDSKSGKQVTCDQDVCSLMYNNQYSACKDQKPCEYSITYADNTTMSGFFVTDTVQFDQVTGNLQTNPTDGTVSFGCSVKQSGTEGTSTDRVSGIIGFGQGNSSIISQLAKSGKVKKTFSHCLDTNNGGGIFAVGQVVDPKVNSTAMVADDGHELRAHYNVMMKKAEIGGEIFDIPTESFFDTGRKTVIDSGATLAYLPGEVYDLIMQKVTAGKSNFKTHVVEPQLKCFYLNGKNIDDDFPTITFHFAGSLTMEVFPREYFVHLRDNEWCVGFQRGGMQTQDGQELILLGDTMLSNKLVVYDLENQTIGWTRYNCSSSIKVKDEVSMKVNSVNSPDLSLAYALNTGMVLAAFMFVATLAIQFY